VLRSRRVVRAAGEVVALAEQLYNGTPARLPMLLTNSAAESSMGNLAGVLLWREGSGFSPL
jgi:hypothetical protein